MTIRLLAFGIAHEILGFPEKEIDFSGVNVGDLRNFLLKNHPDFERLKSLSFAVNETYEKDEKILTNNDVVAIIPPVSGG
mgnify:CR=1 FL=1